VVRALSTSPLASLVNQKLIVVFRASSCGEGGGRVRVRVLDSIES